MKILLSLLFVVCFCRFCRFCSKISKISSYKFDTFFKHVFFSFYSRKICTVCIPNVRFKRSYNLQLHMQTAHSKYVAKAVCPVRGCANPLFSTITNMRVHFGRIHNGKRYKHGNKQKKLPFPKDTSKIRWVWVLASRLINGRRRGYHHRLPVNLFSDTLESNSSLRTKKPKKKHGQLSTVIRVIQMMIMCR